jgi:hypothetical protein
MVPGAEAMQTVKDGPVALVDISVCGRVSALKTMGANFSRCRQVAI